MTSLLGLIVGLFVTMVLIPPLASASGMLRLVDQPNARKVHADPIPRVGGIAIFVGILLPLLIWAQLDRSGLFYLIGGGLIVLLGIVDDRYNLEFKWKFCGQVVAILVAMLGGVHLQILPFCGLDPVTPWVTYPLSFLFILGVTNAMNLSDGLDGLAGGVSMLSLAGLGVIAYAAGGLTLYLGAAALIGAILGFLRFNAHPAVVFMGDAGSQFLGFTLAYMAIVLTSNVNPALNPILPLFLIGLPLLDTLSVIIIRLWHRGSPFKPDKRHFHHRLLAIGFRHYEAVAIIYAVQALAVALGFLIEYQSDALAAAVFLVFATLVYGMLYAAEVKAVRIHAAVAPDPAGDAAPVFVERRNTLLRRFEWLPMATAYYVQFGVSLILLGGALIDKPPSRDIAMVAAGIAAMMVFAHFFLHPWTRLFTRLGVYALSLFVVFLVAPVTTFDATLDWGVNAYLFVLGCVLALAIRLTRRETFQMTPQDLLVLFFVLAVPNMPFEAVPGYPIGSLAVRAALIFYACEFVMSRSRLSFRFLRIAGFVGLCVLGFRGLV
jgi:UDP-GlcNAc:undecaprenyl-phosphate GlcNAc-1-phosphate transferase